MKNRKNSSLKIALTGGGTGGHIYPALATAEILAKEGAQLAYFGRKGGLEEELAKRAGIDFFPVYSFPWHRHRPLSIIWAFFGQFIGIFQGLLALYRFGPDAILATGGFACFPASFSAILLGIPLIIHEQNAVLGLSNRILFRGAKAFAGALPLKKLENNSKFHLTGNPVRESLFHCERENARREMGLSNDNFCILAVGGSRGATSFNKIIPQILDKLDGDTVLILACGQGRIMEVSSFFQGKKGEDGREKQTAKEIDENGQMVPPVEEKGEDGREKQTARKDDAALFFEGANGATLILREYIQDMGMAYGGADLVICRSGAISLAEIAALGKPCITVPFPFAAEDHQLYNARLFQEIGAAILIEEEDFSSGLLIDNIKALRENPGKLEEMGRRALTLAQPDGARKIVDLIKKVIDNA